MRILVFSDSHGKIRRMTEVSARTSADVIIFLGDCVDDFDEFSKNYMGKARLIAVRGNCDGYDGTPLERIIDIEGLKFLMLHGHTRGVKHGTESLEGYAVSVGADIVLYGHTHISDNRWISSAYKPFYVFNPGSIGASLYDRPGYGYIEIRSGQVILNCAEYIPI